MNHSNYSSGVRLLFWIVTASLLIGIGTVYSYVWNRSASAAHNQIEILKNLPAEPLHLNPRTKTADCHVNGPLPDPDCTPGEVFVEATVDKVCVSGYTKTVRNVSVKLKRQVYSQYNIAYPQPYGSYEADHLIPLALGGNNDIANLFPESAKPVPGFKEKDLVEMFLRQEVCAGRMALSSAQQQIAANWLLVYRGMSEGTIQALKRQFGSWAN